MNIYHFISAFVVCVTCLACKKSEIKPYHGQELIYFNDVAPSDNSRRDSVVLSFARMSETATDTIFNLPVTIMGKPTNTDRYFQVWIDQSASTAIAGKHYDALPDRFLIKAGKVAGFLPLKLHRTSDMLANIFTLSLKLIENSDFQVNTAAIIQGTKHTRQDYYKLLMTDIMIEPEWWSVTAVGRLGTFSRKKVATIEAVTGYNLSQIEQYALKYDMPFLIAIARRTQVYLNYQRAMGNIVLDENASPMSMGIHII